MLIMQIVTWEVKQRESIASLLVAQNAMQLNNCLLLFKRKSSSFDIRPQIVGPSETAALSTSLQSYKTKYI